MFGCRIDKKLVEKKSDFLIFDFTSKIGHFLGMKNGEGWLYKFEMSSFHNG